MKWEPRTGIQVEVIVSARDLTRPLRMMLVTGTSALRHGSTELCSILNRAIREDDPNATIHAVVFARAINMCLVHRRTPDPWLKEMFKNSHPCV